MSGRHAASRRRPIRAAWLWLLGLPARLRDDLSDEEKGTVLWVDGLVDRKVLDPAAPARRPRLLTVATVRTAAIIRALPLESVPWLQHGQGYSDSTGTFRAIAQDPPALHADESFSMTRDDMAAGLAEHAKDWTP